MSKDSMISTPGMNFKSVRELTDSKVLNDKEKLIALYNWKQICELEKASTAEGMGGERTTPIAEILEAIRHLEGRD